ncbi:MAG: two-component system, OmpR family, osmolarity sensor histidine kinase EnvZ [Gallionellaceae bacterium]|nr:MAG: two-component system, OmpR family, osmolarity sensor histidine kinase EnvZ [Gallionellaceae bacterium]
MTSLLPKTLLARSFLLIVALIVLSLTTLLFVFRQAEQEPRSQQMAQLVVSVVNLTRAAVLSAAPEWRGALLAELREAEGMRVEMAEADDVLTLLEEGPPEVALMKQKVRAELGPDTNFAAIRNGVDALWVSFRIGPDEFWVALPRERIEHPVSHILLMWGVVTLLLALLGAYLIARQVAYPLKRLSEAAQQVGHGQTPPPLPEEGSHEIATVSRAFNQMSADLEANERERAMVLAGISHDLRTPLARVRLAAELSADASLRDGLSADVTQMDEIIQQFLDYARLDTQESSVPTDVSALIRDAAQPYAHLSKSLTLDLRPLPAQNVRPLLLKRALSNLLDNAVKYGGGEIVIGLRHDEHSLEITVSDRGGGIHAGQLDAAKRPFVRLESARSDAVGSGLGLAIVERAAQIHQGRLVLSQREGGGLVATLRLPLLT